MQALRLLAAAAVLGAGLTTSGCITTAIYLNARPAQSVLNEMERWCKRDAGVVWRSPRLEGVDLWLPGTADGDPVTAKPRYKPYEMAWNNDVAWLRSGVASALYVNIAPQFPSQIGPQPGDPAGVYRIALAPKGDPRCAPFVAAEAETLKRNALAKLDEWTHCPYATYMGPDFEPPRAYSFIRFDDAKAKALGFMRSGEALLADGTPLATQNLYRAYNPRSGSEHAGWWGKKACDTAWTGLPDSLGGWR